MTRQRRLRRLGPWSLAASLSCASAAAGVVPGPEIDVGTLGEGPAVGLPPLALFHDQAGYGALWFDARGPGSGPHLFAARLDGVGELLSPAALVASQTPSALVAIDAEGAFVLVQEGPDAIVLRRLLADGTLLGGVPAGSLGTLPSDLRCSGDSCLGLDADGLFHLDSELSVTTRIDVPTLADVSGFRIGAIAALPSGFVAAASARTATTSMLLSAGIGLDGAVLRPFEPLDVPDPAVSGLRLLSGESGFLVTFSHLRSDGLTDSLRAVPLDAEGRMSGTPTELIQRTSASWAGTSVATGYAFLVGGSEPVLIGVTADGVPSTPVALGLDPELRRTVFAASLASDGQMLLASWFHSTGIEIGLQEPGANLANLAEDGSSTLAQVGLRPSQQYQPLLAAGADGFLSAYLELGVSGVPLLRWSLLDSAGGELGVTGSIEAPIPAGSRSVPASLQPAGDGFLVTVSGQTALIDETGAVSALPLAVGSASLIAGTDVLLRVAGIGGSCGEDCGWSDVAAERYDFEGAPLDAAPLFGTDETPERQRRPGPGVWDGERFLLFAVSGSRALEYRSLEADGTLIDPTWQPLVSSESVDSMAAATAEGTTLLVWTSGNLIHAMRTAASGWLDPEPLELEEARGPALGLAATYDGQRFVVAWQAAGDIRGVELENGGGFRQPAGLTLADSLEVEQRAALASLGDGRSLLAYDRFDAVPEALTSRVKLRLLEEGAAPIGLGCGADADCESGLCTDDVCCRERCDAAGTSCAARENGVLDGECSPVPDDAGEGGSGGQPPVTRASCDEENACPVGFRCDDERGVCLPPDDLGSGAPRGADSGCAVTRPAGASSEPWIWILGAAAFVGRRPRRRNRNPSGLTACLAVMLAWLATGCGDSDDVPDAQGGVGGTASSENAGAGSSQGGAPVSVAGAGPGSGDDCVASELLATGAEHACAVRETGEVVCWGSGDHGALGNGSLDDQPAPVAVSNLTDVRAIGANQGSTCALRQTGNVVCWGRGAEGQLGNGATDDQAVPVAVPDLSDVRAISLGGLHACALRGTGDVVCWGQGINGALGNGTSDDRPTPVAVSNLTAVRAVSAGRGHTCALRDSGEVACWGSAGYGELANTSTVAGTPVAYSDIADASAVSAGGNFTCVLREAGGAVCSGYNRSGQLGDGTRDDRTMPVAVSGLLDAIAVTAGEGGNGHTCALRATGEVVCWGNGYYGQAGNGAADAQLSLFAVSGLPSAVAVSAGGHYSCALLGTGQVACWGDDLRGTLGDGVDPQPMLAPVEGLSDVRCPTLPAERPE